MKMIEDGVDPRVMFFISEFVLILFSRVTSHNGSSHIRINTNYSQCCGIIIVFFLCFAMISVCDQPFLSTYATVLGRLGARHGDFQGVY